MKTCELVKLLSEYNEDTDVVVELPYHTWLLEIEEVIEDKGQFNGFDEICPPCIKIVTEEMK